MSPKRQRLWFVSFAILMCLGAGVLLLSVFRDNIVYFYTPSEMPAEMVSHTGIIRLGGLVEAGSIETISQDSIRFTVTDGHAEMNVAYTGTLPNLFREGQGVVAEGHLQADGSFNAVRILAKHDEQYMPKEVAEKLKSSGYWKDPANAGAP